MKAILTLAVLAALTGCAAQQPAIERETITMGMAGPKPDIEDVKSFVANQLKDPDSAKFRGQLDTFKCYGRSAPISGGKITNYGWCAMFEVSGKNSYGAYVGYRPVRVFIKGSRMITYTGNMHFKEFWLGE